jgi:hypothetical protein
MADELFEGRRFRDADELFEAAAREWREIPQEDIDTLLSSFPGRCQICFNYEGVSLTGHWREVHKLHHAANPATVPAEPDHVDE